MHFLSPTDEKCAKSSTFWQFFYYRPPGKFRYTAGKIVKMWCQEHISIYIDITLSIIDVDFLYQFNLRLHHFSVVFFNVKKKVFQKLAGLWLVGEVVNHVGLYGSKVAEGCSAFQHRSCHNCYTNWYLQILYCSKINTSRPLQW